MHKLADENIDVRQENKHDEEAIRNIHYVAFARKDESNLVDKIRNSDKFVDNLSFVAEIDANLASAMLFKKSNNQFELVSDTYRKQIGHIMFSEISIVDKDVIYDKGILSLAPMSVVTPFQKMGVGAKLLKESIEYIKSKGYDMIVVLGHKDYYSKFGFEKASDNGVISPFPNSEDSFLILKLTENADKIKGNVIYPDIFYSLT